VPCPVGFSTKRPGPGPPVPSADGAREARSRREEEVDARASSTTSNEEIGHDPHRPEGLRRHGPVFFVAAPRRWRDIAVVAPPRIRTHGARNGRRWGPRPGLEGARSTYSTVRRAPRGEKTPLGAVHRRPQQIVGEICRLTIRRFPSVRNAAGEPAKLALIDLGEEGRNVHRDTQLPTHRVLVAG